MHKRIARIHQFNRTRTHAHTYTYTGMIVCVRLRTFAHSHMNIHATGADELAHVARKTPGLQLQIERCAEIPELDEFVPKETDDSFESE